MTSRLLATIITTLPGTAFAHTGHVAEQGGHSHWLALAIFGGLGIALCVYAIARLTRRTKRQRQA